MKIMKIIGPIIVLYIVAYVLLTVLFPDDGGIIQTFLNLLLVGAFIVAVFSLLLGGKNTIAMKKMGRIFALVVAVSGITLFLFSVMTNNADFIYEFVENAFAFGGLLGIGIKMLMKLPETETDFIWRADTIFFYLIENTFKLLLTTILHHILIKYLLIPFFVENDSENHIFPKVIRRVIISLLSAIFTSFTCMFVISEVGKFLTSLGVIGEWINGIYQVIGLVSIFLVLRLTPIMTYKINIVVGLIKMLVINGTFILIVVLFQNQYHFGNVFMTLLACIAICVFFEVFVKEEELFK